MVDIFSGVSVPSLYTKILQKILAEGKEVGPRGLKTKELSPVVIEVTNPRHRLFGHPHRKEVPIFTYIEGLWILLGEDTPDRVVHYVPAMANFISEKYLAFDGAYGQSIRLWYLHTDQLTEAYNRLKADPDTRQAIVVINNPLIHRLPTKDYPCTLSFQFLLRKGKLDMIVNMRSQDAWLGLIYDTGEFQWFQEILAGWLGVDLGRYIHIDGSLHLYERDWAKAQELMLKDSEWNLYQCIPEPKVLDARVPKEEWNILLSNLALVEEAHRTNDWTKLVKGVCIKSDFYQNLVTIIKAYNERLRGNKEFASSLIANNETDLGLIYRRRWLSAEEKKSNT